MFIRDRISGFGTAQITANAMSNNISALSILMGQAMSLAIVTVVGQCVGAQDLRQARGYALTLTGAGALMLTATSGLVMLLLPLIIRLYHASPDTAGYIRQVITLNCIAVPLFWAPSFIPFSYTHLCAAAAVRFQAMPPRLSGDAAADPLQQFVSAAPPVSYTHLRLFPGSTRTPGSARGMWSRKRISRSSCPWGRKTSMSGR